MPKTIGIIGGLSPESTVSYYLHIVRTCRDYPDIIIYSVNRDKCYRWRLENRWDLVAGELIHAARQLEQAGAGIVLIAANTMHKLYDQVQQATSLPLVHILDGTIQAIRGLGFTTVGLLGTLTTMQEPFYSEILAKHGIRAIAPDLESQEAVHRIIVEELVRGTFLDASRETYLRVMQELKAQGAQGIILGCTEIPLLVKAEDFDLPLFDTAVLHAQDVLERALAD